MIVCDTSVLVAAFARWHDSHDVAATAVRRADALIDHVAVETFSVLTRLPAPRRAPAGLVTAFLQHHFPAGGPRLPGPGSGEVLSLDRGASATYQAADVRFELLS